MSFKKYRFKNPDYRVDPCTNASYCVKEAEFFKVKQKKMIENFQEHSKKEIVPAKEEGEIFKFSKFKYNDFVTGQANRKLYINADYYK